LFHEQILPELLQNGVSAREAIEAKGLSQISDAAVIESMVDAIIAENPKQVAAYRGGKTKLQGFFVGQVMKVSGGRVNPALLNKILLSKLNC
jgi:aspartyl-tRNA(Asn)/glutamyl-tRNA(Gln) amidotransferase subunit B